MAGNPMTIPESRELEQERWWRSGADFRWCWPKFDRFRPADRYRLHAMLNRYPHNVIGAACVIFGHGFGIRWKDSRR
jgi:hypothetical protein